MGVVTTSLEHGIVWTQRLVARLTAVVAGSAVASPSDVAFAVAVVLLVALGLYRLLRTSTAVKPAPITGTGELSGFVLRPATKGVNDSFSPAPKSQHWWLEGHRLDLSDLYELLGSQGILQLSTSFYARV